MIYSVTFQSLKSFTIPRWVKDKDYDTGPAHQHLRDARSIAGKTVDSPKIIASLIKESEEDSFVFILTNAQLEAFDAWVKKYELERWMVYRMERAVTNGNHPQNGRNLTLAVFASRQHVWRDMFSSKIEWSLA